MYSEKSKQIKKNYLYTKRKPNTQDTWTVAIANDINYIYICRIQNSTFYKLTHKQDKLLPFFANDETFVTVQILSFTNIIVVLSLYTHSYTQRVHSFFGPLDICSRQQFTLIRFRYRSLFLRK